MKGSDVEFKPFLAQFHIFMLADIRSIKVNSGRLQI